MNKLSAVVTVFNEEKNIERCLRSLKFADEIVVVDNSSADKTLFLAKKFTNKIYSQKNDPNLIDIQKNFGFKKASGDFILSVDGDEEVSGELESEIKKLLKKAPKNINGYLIPRKNFIFGKWIENTGWYPDFQLRLFKKDKAFFTQKHVHEQITLEGKSLKLKGHILHHNYDTVSQFIQKTVNYAENEAEKLLEDGYNFSYFDSLRFPMKEFLSRFFLRKGYKDGLHGLILSLLMAFYHLLIFAYVWEKKGFPQYNSSNFLREAETEFKKAGKETLFWFTKERAENIRNPVKKAAFKIIRKVK